MELIAGNTYDVSALRLIGWTQGDGSGHEGYNVGDFFGDNGQYIGADENGIEPIVEMQQELLILASGGIGFQVSLVAKGDTRGDFLGSMEFGSLDSDGQYEQDDDEIIDAAREQFGIDAVVPAVVR